VGDKRISRGRKGRRGRNKKGSEENYWNLSPPRRWEGKRKKKEY